MSEEITDGFECPHRKRCWQREAIRVGVAALVAGLVSTFGGCAMRWSGLGVNLELTPPSTGTAVVAPQANTAPVLKP